MNILRVKKRALELLERVDSDHSYLHILLQQEAKMDVGEGAEYPVLLQLVRGVLEQCVLLDEVLSPLLPRGLSSLPKEIQNLLRLGAYQICFLDRVKKRDVVFEAVEIAKSGKYKGLAKLVNAVLRKVEAPAAGTAKNVELTASRTFPDWLVARWTKQFGAEEVNSFCHANNQPLPLYLRVNTARTDADSLIARLAVEGVTATPARYSGSASLQVLQLPRDRRIQQLACYEQGLFFVQDLSSTIVADIVSSDLPRRVADVCAAPGGKSCSIALSIACVGGAVSAFDHTPTRVGLIRDTTARLGLQNVTYELRDASHPPSEEWEVYDAVLVDAPCSGFGTLGRKIDARWSKSESDIDVLTELQLQILHSSARLVAVGGSLVYSTCTIERAENEELVEKFIQLNPHFTPLDLTSVLPEQLCCPGGFYRSWPHRHAMSGAFAAKLRKRDTQSG